MWSAVVEKIEQLDGIIVISVSYSDGVKSLGRTYKPMVANATTGWLANQVDQQIAELDGMSAVNLTTGPITPVPVIPPVPSAKDVFISNLQKLKNTVMLNNLGVLTADTVALVKWLQDNYQESYLEGWNF